MARLGDLFLHIRNGANIKQGLDNTGYPITRIETISNRTVDRNKMGYAGITDLEKYSDFVMQDGDILMSHINSETHLGKTALYEKEGDEIIIHGMNLLSLRPNKDLITSKYAFYHLSSQSFLRQIPNITKKSVNQASFTVSALKELVFPLMSIEKQKKITVDLDKVNDLISLRKQQLSKLDELVKARFVELFGLPVSNSKNWKTEKMNDIAPAVNYSGDFEETVWLLNLDMVEAQTGRIIDYLYVAEEEVGNSTCTFDTSNVLYSKLRPYLNKVVIPDRCGYATSEMIPLKPNPMKLERTYLAFMLRSDEFVNMINEKVAGAKMPRVSMGDFRGFDVPVPPIELQKQFTALVEQTDKSKFEIQKSLEKLETLKKALMQKYFG